MEDPIQIPNTTQNQPPSTVNTNKRSLENGHFHYSTFFKIRAIARDIRPHFIQVLNTPDFQNCVAAQEIRDQMKLITNLYKEMMDETTRCMNLPETKTETQKIKEDGNIVADKSIPSVDFFEDLQSEDGRRQGTFIVGGSAFGWNFITYSCGKAVYYGRTKEMFRAENVVVTDDLPRGE